MFCCFFSQKKDQRHKPMKHNEAYIMKPMTQCSGMMPHFVPGHTLGPFCHTDSYSFCSLSCHPKCQLCFNCSWKTSLSRSWRKSSSCASHCMIHCWKFGKGWGQKGLAWKSGSHLDRAYIVQPEMQSNKAIVVTAKDNSLESDFYFQNKQ